MQEENSNVPRTAEALFISMHLLDKVGIDRIVHSTLPVEYISLRKKRSEKSGDKIVDIFNLILFDFDRSDLNPTNARIVDFIKSKLDSTAKLWITGYSDRTGDNAYNERLSADRAEATRRALGRSDASVEGVGEAQLLYPNELPEGRFYCRTVRIVSERTVK